MILKHKQKKNDWAIFIIASVFIGIIAISALGLAGIANNKIVYGVTWRWSKNSSNQFCVQKTPETGVAIFCKATAQLEENTLLPLLNSGDTIDFHEVPITTSLSIDVSSGARALEGLIFENGRFIYGSTQILTIQCTRCVAFLSPAVTDTFSTFSFNTTGRTISTDTVVVKGFQAAFFPNWSIIDVSGTIGSFQLTEDTSSVSQSTYSNWQVSNVVSCSALPCNNPFILQVASNALVTNCQMFNIDNGINVQGSQTTLTANVFLTVFGNAIKVSSPQVTITGGNQFLNVINKFAIDAIGGSTGTIISYNTFSSDDTGQWLIEAGASALIFGNQCVILVGTCNPIGTFPVTVGTSPFTYTDNENVLETLYISGGTISLIVKNGQTLFTTTNVSVSLYPGQAVTVTYSVLPTIKVDEF